jgi:mono/diheme cytochrome c family protein
MVCAAAATAAQAQQDAALEPSPTAAQILPGAVEPATGDDAASASEAMPVDFFVDIWPILNAHCVKCHGPERRSSGLRLDGRKFAMRGGDSGRIVLGGTPATNELYARVSSSDRSYRMPKNAPPLSDREIAVLRRWVEQGAPWPVLEETPQSQSFFDRWVAYLGDQVDRYEPEYHYAQPYTIAFLLVQCAMLVVLRCRTAYRKGRPWSRGRLAAFCRFCDGVKPREVLLVVLVSLAALALAWSRGHTLEIESRLARAKTNQGQTHSPWTDTVFGWPPKPVRPDHPKQVAGTYYRGNCERNPELFNGGNYLTATFRVKLCDEEHKQLEVGRPLPAAGVFVYVEIERAPGTTDQLFSKELMESVVLVRNFYESPNNELKEEPVRLEALEPAMRWGAYVPIGLPDKAGRLDGVIYIYTGQVTNNTFGGSLHYAVQYALAFADGKLSPESDLWMDSFGNFAFESPRPPGKLPYREWFDYRPMPVITGENSKDPKLLGIEEYVEQGLIKGEKSKAPEPSPESEPPAQAEEPPDDK